MLREIAVSNPKASNEIRLIRVVSEAVSARLLLIVLVAGVVVLIQTNPIVLVMPR